MPTLSQPTVAIVTLAALTLVSCGSPTRHPMDQRDIDKCLSGLDGLIPDDKARKSVCECTADAIAADRVYSGIRDEAYENAHHKRVQECGPGAGLSRSDPFGILDHDPANQDDESPAKVRKICDDIDCEGAPSDEYDSEDQSSDEWGVPGKIPGS